MTYADKTSLQGLPPLKEVIALYGLAAKKSLGQNFILDGNITDKIARLADIGGKTVFEVGPGPGGLTRSLLKAGARSVIALEKDNRCLHALQDIQALCPNLKTISGDALKLTLESLELKGITLVANLPYNIGTRLLLNWCQEKSRIEKMVLMFQKEVADRLIARPQTSQYGSLSIWIQWQWQVTSLLTLPPSAFSPAPKVESSVVEFIPRLEPLAPANAKALQKLLNTSFQQRRKMLRRSLKSLDGFTESWFEIANISPSSRPEELSIQDFCRLSACL